MSTPRFTVGREKAGKRRVYLQDNEFNPPPRVYLDGPGFDDLMEYATSLAVVLSWAFRAPIGTMRDT